MMCFDCLKRRINADLSDEVTFCYGLSNSPLPFGNSAVVQVDLMEVNKLRGVEVFFCCGCIFNFGGIVRQYLLCITAGAKF